MRILGIDPGIATIGFGVVDSDGGSQRLLQCGVITTPAHTSLSSRLDQIYDDMSDELMIPEKRDITLMYLSQDDIEKSIEVTPEEIAAYYKEHIDEYEKPEQRRVMQMVFDDENTAKAVASALSEISVRLLADCFTYLGAPVLTSLQKT